MADLRDSGVPPRPAQAPARRLHPCLQGGAEQPQSRCENLWHERPPEHTCRMPSSSGLWWHRPRFPTLQHSGTSSTAATPHLSPFREPRRSDPSEGPETSRQGAGASQCRTSGGGFSHQQRQGQDWGPSSVQLQGHDKEPAATGCTLLPCEDVAHQPHPSALPTTRHGTHGERRWTWSKGLQTSWTSCYSRDPGHSSDAQTEAA